MPGGSGAPNQAGEGVAAVLGVLKGNVAAILEGGGGDGELGAALGGEFDQGVGMGRRGRLGKGGPRQNGKKRGGEHGFHGFSLGMSADLRRDNRRFSRSMEADIYGKSLCMPTPRR